MTKVCSKCKKELDLSAFGKCSKSKDGLKSACKECRNAIKREYNLHAYKNKLHIPKIQSGENNYNAKLSYKVVLFIREHYKARSKEYSGKKLASMFGVSKTVITNIIKRKSWNNDSAKEFLCE